MPLYLLDTNVISDLLRGDAQLRSRVNTIVPPDRLAIPIIVAGELLFGLKRMPDGARRQRLQAKLNSILTTLSIELILELAATHYAEIKVFRQTAGRNLDENHLWIAAATVAVGAILVTRDSDFVGTPNLITEDWTRALP